MTDWHNCDGEILEHIKLVKAPLPEFNDGQPCFALTLAHSRGAFYMPIRYCPICGEFLELPPRHYNEPHDCEHEFFDCQVPAGDSCVAIYHRVCKKCRWDATRGCVMWPEIWRGYAIPQLAKAEGK